MLPSCTAESLPPLPPSVLLALLVLLTGLVRCVSLPPSLTLVLLMLLTLLLTFLSPLLTPLLHLHVPRAPPLMFPPLCAPPSHSNVSRERAHPVESLCLRSSCCFSWPLTLTMQTLSSHIQQFNLTATGTSSSSATSPVLVLPGRPLYMHNGHVK